jgi:cytoskeletal protein CcmA (bactofilin family)
VESIDVGGSFKSFGDFDFGDIDVGGAVKIEGPARGISIDVGGTLHVEKSLFLKDMLDVGGAVNIDENLQCSRIDVGGTLTVKGRIDGDTIDVGGRILTKHAKVTNDIRIGKRGEVQGFVEAKSILIRERARAETLYGDEIRVEERGRVKNLYGRAIYLERESTVEGEILYTESCQVEDRVAMKAQPRRVDALPSPDQLIGTD